jgi:hypothetical protein
MSEASYDGIFGGGFAFVFTPTTGTPFGSTQAQIDEATPAKVTVDTAKFTPISGANSGVEQFALGRYPVSEYAMKWTYNAAAYAAALACQTLKLKGTLVCTYGDGSTDTYVGAALTMLESGANTGTALRDGTLSFTCPVGPTQFTFSAGTGITVVQTTVAMSTGTGTIDLYAAPFTGNGLKPIRMFLMNPVGNGAITIVFGSSTPYTGFGAAFDLVLQPGESAALNATTAISSTVRKLDISGTGSQSLIVQVQMQA